MRETSKHGSSGIAHWTAVAALVGLAASFHGLAAKGACLKLQKARTRFLYALLAMGSVSENETH